MRYVEEGWWHPNVKGGTVHEHKPNMPMTMHRTCEPVFTCRAEPAGDDVKPMRSLLVDHIAACMVRASIGRGGEPIPFGEAAGDLADQILAADLLPNPHGETLLRELIRHGHVEFSPEGARGDGAIVWPPNLRGDDPHENFDLTPEQAEYVRRLLL